jgi:hypothetical protein
VATQLTPADQVFRLLALCAQRPGHPQIATRLPPALAAAPPGIDLVECAAQHGLAPLLLAHIREAKAAVAPSVNVRLFAQQVDHVRAAAVRARVVREAVDALTAADVPLLVLKGAALAQLVYAEEACRPMRDVDLLVRRPDARRAYETLRRLGFAPGERATAPAHHHLPGLLKTEDGTTISIELHHELLQRTPFVAPMVYDDLRPAAQTFEWAGLTLQTLGREDMLWHVYAHAFVINTLCPGIRLISIADLVHATEAWVDLLDWDALGRRYGRLVRALPLVHSLTPWSARVTETLGVRMSRPLLSVRSASSSLHWSGIASRDVLWPAEWWFRMRYGIDGPRRWMWYRGAGHPLRVGMAAAGSAARRISRRLRVSRPHRLLQSGASRTT